MFERRARIGAQRRLRGLASRIAENAFRWLGETEIFGQVAIATEIDALCRKHHGA